jgi:hypothetical protein
VGLATVFDPFGEVKKNKKSRRLWMATLLLKKECCGTVLAAK